MNDQPIAPPADAPADLRAGVRAALAGELVRLQDTAAVAVSEVVANLAAAYAALGGDLELDAEARAPELGVLKAELETLRIDRDDLKALRAAVDKLLAASEEFRPDDFPPRLEALVPGLERLATVRAGGTYIERPAA